MNLLLRCSFEQLCDMNMMGGSVKTDGGIFKIHFCVLWLPYATAGGAGKFDELTWPNTPSKKLFHDLLSVIIGDDHSLLRESWLADTLPGSPLPVKEWNQINHGNFVYPLHELLDLVQ